MLEAIAYNNSLPCTVDLEKALKSYLANELPSSVAQYFHYEVGPNLHELLENFSPTPHILVRCINLKSAEVVGVVDDFIVHNIINSRYVTKKAA